MVKRNDPCPCGSGKKYKNCCLNKQITPKELWKKQALSLGSQCPFNEELVITYFALFDHSLKNNWRGACHGLSSVLLVLLKEQGIDCELHLGYAKAPNMPSPFCHSWITINGEIFDMALYRSNPPYAHPYQYIEVSPPIFKGINLETNEPTLISYGVNFDREASDRTYQQLKKMTFGNYMNGWPSHKDGLWGEIMDIAKSLNLCLNIQDLKTRYSNKAYKN